MHTPRWDTPVPTGTDPRERARTLARTHEDTLSGRPPREAPRPIISASWHRLMNQGMDPERGRAHPVLDTGDLEHRRSETHLAAILPTLRATLTSSAEQCSNIMVVTDSDGHVLWRDGHPAVRHHADRLGFITGSCWREDTVGTNAIGTALVTGQPVQVYSAEHFVRSHHTWTCSAAPIREPRTGHLLGTIDLSGPLTTVHPSTLALATTVAQLAETQLRHAHHADLDKLRAVAAPILARTAGQALATDTHGWVAATTGLAPLTRVTLPATPEPHSRLPGLGLCSLEPLPGGWLIRPEPTDTATPTALTLDLTNPRHALLHVRNPSGNWQCDLSPRHADILYILTRHPKGRTAAQLATDLFGDPHHTVTIRAEMSRLRRYLPGLLRHRPYRIAETVTTDIATTPGASALPHSRAPEVRRLHSAPHRSEGPWDG